MLLEYSAQFIDVDKSFGTVGLSASQTSSQGVPELHGWQIVGGGLGMLGLEEGQDLGAVLCESWAVLHKLGGGRKQEGWEDEVTEGGQSSNSNNYSNSTPWFRFFAVHTWFQYNYNNKLKNTVRNDQPLWIKDSVCAPLRELTSVNNLWFSACRTCASFFAEAKGDWVMWVGAGCWALSCETFLSSRWEDKVEAEQEGWGLLSSSSSSRTMILSAIEAGATAIQNVGCFCFQKTQTGTMLIRETESTRWQRSSNKLNP